MFISRLSHLRFASLTLASTLLLLINGNLARAAEPAASRAEPIPALSIAASYEVPAESAKHLSLQQWTKTLVVEMRSFAKDKQAQLALKEPLPFPEWANGFVFSVNNPGNTADLGVSFQVLTRDANGQTFRYRAESAKVPHRVQYFPNQQRARSIRFSVPGLERPVLVPAAGGNVEPVGERRLPKAPLRLAGLQLESVAFHPRKGEEEKANAIYLSDFAFTNLSRQGSEFYYALDGEERFGALDPVPAVTLGQLGPHYGEEFSVSWEARNRYDGQPFLTGGRQFSLKENAPEYPLLLNQKIEIPVRERGTYWIEIVRRWSQKAGSPAPQRIDAFAYRLDILKGSEPGPRAPIAAGERVANASIRIAPERKSLIYAAAEPMVVNTTFWRPERGGATWRLEARRVNGDEVLKTAEGALSGERNAASAGDAQPVSVPLDLTELPASAYRVRATLLVDGKAIDEVERIVGKAGAAGSATGAAKIPASIPSWQTMLASDKSLVYLQPHLDESDPAKRWERFKAFLDQVPSVTSKIEFLFRWRDVEPMPGVFDWSELDRVLAYAETKGITALLWPSIVGSEPEWLPSVFEEPRNASGSIFGAPAYLYHGGRLNLWHAPAIREPALRFLTAVAARYRRHAAVHGYYVLTEHPGDSPVHNWLIGGSPETQANFRRYCQKTFGTVAALNRRWKTEFPSWEAIGAPGEMASALQRLDWLVFLREAMGDFLVDAAKALRQADAHRIIQVYLEGTDSAALNQLKALGCMVSDGGSQYPETFGGEAMGIAEHGLQRRAEEVSVGQWSAMFPTQLDATLFTMLLGGGANANIKMFIPATKTFEELRRAPHSLDRFTKFIPIWNELRPTKPMPREAFTLFDRNAQLLQSGTTQFFGDTWGNTVCMEAGLLAPWVPLEMAVKGKLIFLPRVTAYEQKVVDGLVDYVKGGGRLVMCADAGRHVPEAPDADWVLLRQLGFSPPAEAKANENYATAVPVAGGVFSAETKRFRLREVWSSTPGTDERVLATLQGDARRAAITAKTIGKGRAVVVWASTLVPAGQEFDPLLRDVARWAGVTIHAEGTPASFWTNLVEDSARRRYYGLAYRSGFPGNGKGPALEGKTRWFLPEGNYRVTELIHGREIGVLTAAALKDGITAKLQPYEVAIYRIEPTPGK